MTYRELFEDRPPLIGVVRLRALPGSPAYRGDFIETRRCALRDADALVHGGFDAVLIENCGDGPFTEDRVPPETVAALSVLAAAVSGAVTVPVGLSVLRNDGRAAVAAATAAGAAFVRLNVHVGVVLTDQGIVEGRAAETLRWRSSIGSEVALLTDVGVRVAKPVGPRDAARVAHDCYFHGLAHALIVHDAGEEALAVRRAAPEAPIIVAGALSQHTIAGALAGFDGVILDDEVQPPGKHAKAIDPRQVREWTSAAGR
jgi:membrane complex biogenesis BtpA family protein